MEKKEKKPRILLWILIGIVILLAASGIIFREQIRLIWFNNVDPVQPLPEGEWTGGKTHLKVRYSEISENDYMNLYVPDGETKPPLMVLVHGGGFVTNDCESRQARLFYSFFRDHGYACATVNYRLAQEAVFPAAVEDVKCAVRFLRAHAEDYGYDAERIAIWGESAGGYLAVMAGVTREDQFSSLKFIGEEERTEPVSGAIDFVIDYYGAVELESGEERYAALSALGIPKWMAKMANSWLTDATKDYPWAENCEEVFLGRPLKEIPKEELQNVSPLYHAERNLTPEQGPDLLILHGDADMTVPWTQSRHLYETAVAKMGEEKAAFHLIPNAKHADEDLYSPAQLTRVLEWLETKRDRK